MVRKLLPGFALLACMAAICGCRPCPPPVHDDMHAVPKGLIDIADTPGIARNEAFQPVQPPRPAVDYPGPDAALEKARDDATQGMPPGKVAGGAKKELTIRPVEEPTDKLPLPPPQPVVEPAKPVLKSRALNDLK